MSSPLAFMSAAAVIMAGVAFLVTDHEADNARQQATLASAPARIEPVVTLEALRVKPVVERSEAYIDVYNNSNITGLAMASQPGSRVPAGRAAALTTGKGRSPPPRSITRSR